MCIRDSYNGGHDIEEEFRPKVFGASLAFLAKYLRFSARPRAPARGPAR